MLAMSKRLQEKSGPTFQILEESSQALPKGVTPLSPILALHPHDTEFQEPIMLVLPTCTGAEKVWRSRTSGGWEPIQDVEFFGNYAVVVLSHFCEMFVGTNSQREQLIVQGFLDPNTRSAKCAVMHATCAACEEELKRLQCFQNPDILDGFEKCNPPKFPGSFAHGEVLVLSHGEGTEEVPLKFNRFPRITSQVQSLFATYFQVSIEDEPHIFRSASLAGMPL